MVWAPNVGINYPFHSGTASPPAVGTPDFIALDTNRDGVIDLKDDPYTPYYPGDTYVDWVGLSLYWYPDAGTGFNIAPDPRYFLDQITGTGASILKYQPAVNGQANRNFYQNFAVTRNKPLIIPETSSPEFPQLPQTQPAVQIKQDWWRQMLEPSTTSKFPMIKAVVWFEEVKNDGVNVRDWTLASTPSVLSAFQTDVAGYVAAKAIVTAPVLKVSCGGGVVTFA